MNKATQLLTVLLALAAKQNQSFDAAAVTEQLQEAAANNGLDASDQVPDWLLTFFAAIHTGQVIIRQRIPASEPFIGDIANFVAELEDIIQFKWDDSGEMIEIVATRFRMFGTIFSEGAAYEVSALRD